MENPYWEKGDRFIFPIYFSGERGRIYLLTEKEDLSKIIREKTEKRGQRKGDRFILFLERGERGRIYLLTEKEDLSKIIACQGHQGWFYPTREKGDGFIYYTHYTQLGKKGTDLFIRNRLRKKGTGRKVEKSEKRKRGQKEKGTKGKGDRFILGEKREKGTDLFSLNDVSLL